MRRRIRFFTVGPNNRINLFAIGTSYLALVLLVYANPLVDVASALHLGRSDDFRATMLAVAAQVVAIGAGYETEARRQIKDLPWWQVDSGTLFLLEGVFLLISVLIAGMVVSASPAEVVAGLSLALMEGFVINRVSDRLVREHSGAVDHDQ